MKRPLGILWNVSTLLPLLLCLAAIALQVRSHFAQDLLVWSSFDRALFRSKLVLFTWNKGDVDFGYAIFDFGPNRPLVAGMMYDGWRAESIPTSDAQGHATWYWANYRTQTIPYLATSDGVNPRTVQAWHWGAKGWLIALITGIFPAFRIIARLRRRRGSSLGACATCGYDLRATPDRCPECGTIPTR
jgi:hypothetical protein